MPGENDKYRLLSGEEGDTEDRATFLWSDSQRDGPRQRRRIAFATAVITVLFLTLGIVSYKTLSAFETFSSHSRKGRELGDCGTTVQEARAKGCVFDYLSYVWVQPPCYYPHLLAEYNNRTGVKWYTDPSLNDEFQIPDEEIRRGEHPEVWAPRKFHAMHCAFTVSKIHYALANHEPLDSRANSFEHTKHCQLVLLDEIESCSTPGKCSISKVSAKLTSCGWV
ncbi:hypothetical protein E4U43_000716 [Claviceps pusilla]|uniref:Uncharacterized protein n=1 Tax=Claviceps pusilla TaxID=123648 RepID=A0A9P7NBH5_9HYPO|nr:hypothetical protein E4U43_000716 [Claviceps pusilla]